MSDLVRDISGSGLLFLIALYRAALAPHLGTACRFWPSCSAYADEAVRTHGAWRGTVLLVARLLRCRPGGGQGFDPVPAARGR